MTVDIGTYVNFLHIISNKYRVILYGMEQVIRIEQVERVIENSYEVVR